VAFTAVGCGTDVIEPNAEALDTLDLPLAFEPWSTALSVEAIAGTHADFNSPSLDGCPFVSSDGKAFFMASTRPGGLGGIDIWMVQRAGSDDPWGEPVNVGAPVNTEFNDFCPTLAHNGEDFFFVSNRDGGCGGADIYQSRLRSDGTFEDPENLGCEVNSSADEHSPFPLPREDAGPTLYFSSFRVGGYSPDSVGAVAGDADVYMSEWEGDAFGAPALVPGVNSDATDGQPNVRRDGREIFFYSTRPGGAGGPDIWSATRERPSDVWSEPVNLGAAVNSPAGESRPSLSWDGRTLYFGSGRPGGDGDSDIYRTMRNPTP